MTGREHSCAPKSLQISKTSTPQQITPLLVRPKSSYVLALTVILLIAALLRLNNINQPLVDVFSWRQTSTAMMADNYYRSHWNIFFPATNWNGPEPSYQGREFQTVSYIAALLYVLLGQQDWIGRAIAVVFGIWGIFALFQLTVRVWDRDRALITAAIMTILPGSIFIERSFLPDPAMVALVTTSAWMLVSYLQTDKKRYLILACLIGIWGLLTKIPGAIVGLPILYALFTILKAKGQLSFSKLVLIGIVGVVTCIPVAAYYFWARHLSVTYPPYHFAGSGNWVWDRGLQEWLARSYFLTNLQWIAYNWLWTAPAVYLCFIGLFVDPKSHPSKEDIKKFRAPWFFHWWLLAGIVYYIIGAKELVDNPWNFHIMTPPIAALIAAAIVWLTKFISQFSSNKQSWIPPRVIFFSTLGMFVFAIALTGYVRLEKMYEHPYADESYQLGLALHQVSQPDDLVVTMASDLGDPNAIYYSRRRGWTFPPALNEIAWNELPKDDDFAIQLYENLRTNGADWFGIAAENFDTLWIEHPQLAAHIEQTGQFYSKTDDYIIYKILNSEELDSRVIHTPQPKSGLDDEAVSSPEIHLSIPQVEKATLVWGINDWMPIDSDLTPQGTFEKAEVMYTPMQFKNGRFVAHLSVPEKATLDFGFLIVSDAKDQEEIWLSNNESGFQIETDKVKVIHVHAVHNISAQGAQPFNFTLDGWLLALLGLGIAVRIVTTRDYPLPLNSAYQLTGNVTYLYDLLRELVSRDLKLRYKRSVLGIVWSLINPLALLLVLYFIFDLVLPLDISNYPSFLFIGLLVWTWFQSALFSATTTIVDSPDLIKRPGFPVAVLPIVTVITHLIHFLLALPILFAFLLISGISLSMALLLLPGIMALQFLLTLGISYFLAAIHVSFRDTQYLLGIILLLGFYLSPIFYQTSLIPETYQWLYRLNPMVSLLEAYRTVLIEGSLPTATPLIAILAASIATLWIGYRFFIQASYRFVEEL